MGTGAGMYVSVRERARVRMRMRVKGTGKAPGKTRATHQVELSALGLQARRTWLGAHGPALSSAFEAGRG